MTKINLDDIKNMQIWHDEFIRIVINMEDGSYYFRDIPSNSEDLTTNGFEFVPEGC